jgi:hypothetical protein
MLDKLKPWPFDRIEAFPGGVGAMLDDVSAGLALGIAIALVVAARRRIRGPWNSPGLMQHADLRQVGLPRTNTRELRSEVLDQIVVRGIFTGQQVNVRRRGAGATR